MGIIAVIADIAVNADIAVIEVQAGIWHCCLLLKASSRAERGIYAFAVPQHHR